MNHNRKVDSDIAQNAFLRLALWLGISISNRRSAGVINAHITPLPKVAV